MRWPVLLLTLSVSLAAWGQSVTVTSGDPASEAIRTLTLLGAGAAGLYAILRTYDRLFGPSRDARSQCDEHHRLLCVPDRGNKTLGQHVEDVRADLAAFKLEYQAGAKAQTATLLELRGALIGEKVTGPVKAAGDGE